MRRIAVAGRSRSRPAPTPIVLLAILICALAAVSAPPAARAADPTIGDAQADFAAGQYRDSLQKISRILSGPWVKPGSPERYDLLVLRGECLLQLKQAPIAQDAFESASRVTRGQGDLARTATAKATAALIKASPGLRYKPAGASKEDAGIDIVAPESRKAAMDALWTDRLAALEPKIKQAMASTSLEPIHDLLPAMADLYAIEIASTGDAKRTQPIARSLGEHARGLMTAEIGKLIARIDALNDLAGEPNISRGVLSETIGYRGLTSPERDELKQAADYIVKIQRAAEEGRRINRRLGGDGAAWDTILADCAVARDHAQQAYDKRY